MYDHNLTGYLITFSYYKIGPDKIQQDVDENETEEFALLFNLVLEM